MRRITNLRISATSADKKRASPMIEESAQQTLAKRLPHGTDAVTLAKRLV